MQNTAHNKTPLQRNIIATICYYAVLEYPLTAFELWRHLIEHGIKNTIPQRTPLSQLWSDVDTLVGAGVIAHKNGFYTLPTHTYLFEERRDRAAIARPKLARLRRAVGVFRFVPFVRGVFVTGRLAMKNTQKSSDLDVLIILAYNHIWMGRLLVTAMTVLLGVRRSDARHQDHVCLNYFITDKSLEVPTQDQFGAHEYSWAFPLFGAQAFRRFQFANGWISQYRPHYMIEDVTNGQCLADNAFAKVIRRTGEILFGNQFFESVLRSLQQKKIARNKKTHRDGALIIANDNHLVFLPSPHGPKVERKYQVLLRDL